MYSHILRFLTPSVSRVSALLVTGLAVSGNDAHAFTFADYGPSNGVFGSDIVSAPATGPSAPILYLTSGGNPAGSQATRTGLGTFAGYGTFGITASVSDGALAGDQGQPGGGHWGSSTFPVPGFSVIARPTAITISQSMVSDPLKPLVPVGGLQVLGYKGDVDTNVTIVLDFSTLTTGYLPVGSLIGFNDVDGGESASLLGQFSGAGASNWWEFVAGGDSSESGITSGQPDAGPGDLPSHAGSATPGELVLTGQSSLTDAPVVFFRTLKPLDTLTIVSSDNDTSGYFQSFAIAIPEPGSAILIFSALALANMASRRRS